MKNRENEHFTEAEDELQDPPFECLLREFPETYRILTQTYYFFKHSRRDEWTIENSRYYPYLKCWTCTYFVLQARRGKYTTPWYCLGSMHRSTNSGYRFFVKMTATNLAVTVPTSNSTTEKECILAPFYHAPPGAPGFYHTESLVIT